MKVWKGTPDHLVATVRDRYQQLKAEKEREAADQVIKQSDRSGLAQAIPEALAGIKLNPAAIAKLASGDVKGAVLAQFKDLL